MEVGVLSMLNREGSSKNKCDASCPPLRPTQKEKRERQSHDSRQITSPSHGTSCLVVQPGSETSGAPSPTYKSVSHDRLLLLAALS